MTDLIETNAALAWGVTQPCVLVNVFTIKNGMEGLKAGADTFKARFKTDMVDAGKQGRRGDELNKDDSNKLEAALATTFATVNDSLAIGPLAPASIKASELLRQKMKATWWAATSSWETAATEMEMFGSVRVTFDGDRTIAVAKVVPLVRYLRCKAAGGDIKSTVALSALQLKQDSQSVTPASVRTFFRNLDKAGLDELSAFCAAQGLDAMIRRGNISVGGCVYLPPGFVRGDVRSQRSGACRFEGRRGASPLVRVHGRVLRPIPLLDIVRGA